MLDDETLERSPVVANSAMNRERGIAGSNSYARDLSLDPLSFLQARLRDQEQAAWLDLCCGTGRALIEAGQRLQAAGLAERITLLGIDLVPMFYEVPPDLPCVRLEATSLASWTPGRSYDLITCVHGLHYIGDKLGLIRRAVSWLEPDGVFVANLDAANLRFADGRSAGRSIIRDLRQAGFSYDTRKRLLFCRGRRALQLPYPYVGADDQAGPNYTGQPAVDSYYVAGRSEPRRLREGLDTEGHRRDRGTQIGTGEVSSLSVMPGFVTDTNDE
jgi:SAM-dependent methyltransferase